jgi:hypothetical protein
MDLLKINLYFSEAWWLNDSTYRPAIEFGPNFTDLPINSIYPFYSPNSLSVDQAAGTVKVKTEDKTKPAALTLYCDFNNTNFWKGLQNVGPKFSSPTQDRYSAVVPQVIFPASRAVVAEMRKQLELLFAVTNVPEPVMTSYRLWNGQDDFEFAYHQWQLNADDQKIINYLANPVPGIFMCNEAISDMQGWVNGSLRSSDIALGRLSGGVIKPMTDTPCKSPLAPAPKSAGAKREARRAHGPWG